MTFSRLTTNALYQKYTAINISGGARTIYSDYTYHVFTTSGTFTIPQTINLTTVDAFVVGAGGGVVGGSSVGGGGGGLVAWTASAVSAGNSYTVTVGQGVSLSDGQSSIFQGITATGGKKGGNYDDTSGNSGIPSSLGATTARTGGNQTGQGNGGGAGYSANGSDAPASYVGGAGGEGYTTDSRLREVLGGSPWVVNVLCSGGGGGTDTRTGIVTFGYGGTGAGRGTTALYGAASSYGSGASGGGWTSTGGPGVGGLVIIRYTTL